MQLALEVLTGACATLPDPELGGPDEDEEEIDVEDGECDQRVLSSRLFYLILDVMNGEDEDMAVDHGAAAAAAPELPVSSMLPSLVSPLLSLLQPTALSFPPLAALSIHPPTTSALSVIHVSALECLNNLFLSLAASHKSSVSSDKEAGLTVWNGVWSALKLVGMETGLGQERRQEIREVAIGVLWGVGNVWKGLIVRQLSCLYLIIKLTVHLDLGTR